MLGIGAVPGRAHDPENIPLTSQAIASATQAAWAACWERVACGFWGLGTCGKEANAFVWRDRSGAVYHPLSSISHPSLSLSHPSPPLLSLSTSLPGWVDAEHHTQHSHPLSTSHTHTLGNKTHTHTHWGKNLVRSTSSWWPAASSRTHPPTHTPECLFLLRI